MEFRHGIILAGLLLVACGGGGGSSGTASDPGSHHPPSNSGNWYQPAPAATWQWQLQGTINTSYAVDIYDIDLFEAPDSVIADLHNAGRKVICYFSAGSYENWRPDAAQFTAGDVGKAMDGWPGEYWIDIRSANVRGIMAARLDLAKRRGCDGVEPDNVEGYNADTGFPLTANDQLDFNRFIAGAAHDRGLAVALKNDVDQIAALVGDFDFAVNEECFYYKECDTLTPFIQAGKPVLQAEYAGTYVNNASARAAMCADSLNRGFSTLVLPLDLDDSFRYSCR